MARGTQGNEVSNCGSELELEVPEDPPHETIIHDIAMMTGYRKDFFIRPPFQAQKNGTGYGPVALLYFFIMNAAGVL